MNDRLTPPRPPIAIVGVGAMFPGTPGRDGFWRDIVAGTDNLTEVPPTHWLIDDYYDPDPAAPDKTYCKRGGFLSPVEFDPLEFGIPPTALPGTDTAQLLALVVAKQVLEDATRTQFHEIDKRRVSVVLGVASTTELVVSLGSRLQYPIWVKALRESGLPEDQVQAICARIADNYVPWQESSFPGLLGNVVAGRIANRLDLGGTNCVTDAACASSLSALSLGLNELYLGHSDMVIAGGVDALNDILMYMCFSKTPAFSPSGDCRPFSDQADGTMLGEGLGMFALRRLDDAERDGNRIHAVVRGLGSSSDGRATSIYGPRSQGQAMALRRAYEEAGYEAATVELIEAHGTGTTAGDAAEFGGLMEVFDDGDGGRRQWCALGSVKSQIGHTKAAAGAAGLFKAVMALRHKVLPPTIKVEQPNPDLHIDESPFYINTRARPWINGGGHPRRASVSAFGFGGSNFHVTLEEYTGPGEQAARIHWAPSELVLVAADSADALAERCRQLGGEVATEKDLAGRARRSQETFDAAAPARLAVIASSPDDLKEKLDDAAQRLAAAPDQGFALPGGVHCGIGAPFAGRIAFLFPGQGSQYVNMGADLAMAFDASREIWDADAGGTPEGRHPLHRVVFPPPTFTDEARRTQERELTAMANAQPAIAAVSLSQLALLGAMGLRADCVGGHSFGEVTALHAGGAFDVATTLGIARRRGELMTEAAADSAGAMIAVSADRASMEKRLETWDGGVVMANDNSPAQVILSGAVEAIDEAETRLVAEGVSCTRLSVASAFHSPIVSGSRDPFHEFLGGIEISPPRIPVYANATAAPYPTGAEAVRRQLANQLTEPVRFREQIEAMYGDGVRLFMEVGPGSVLTGLVGQCLDGRPHEAVSLDRRGQNGLVQLYHALGRLAALGVNTVFAPLWADVEAAGEKSGPPPHAVAILGANYGKPYPPPEGAEALPAPNPVSERQPAGKADSQSSATHHWAAFEAFQRETAETHRTFQQAMAESHQAFLSMAENALDALTGEKRRDVPPTVSPILPEITPAPPAPPTPPAPQPAPAMAAPVVAAPAVGTDVGALLLDVVAEKTGYPLEMLDLEMELEAGLGIDSIKQVEILSALRERAPGLPEVEPAHLAELKTLGAIVRFLEESGGGAAPVAAPAIGPDVGALLLDVVAEKTGYPLEMLDLEMELEAGLGIDSIKQVEILSALRERAPGLPEVEPTHLAELKTLGAIVRFLEEGTAPPQIPEDREEALSEPSLVTVTRHILKCVDAPAAGFSLPGIRNAGLVAITPDGNGVAEALAEELEARGIDTRVGAAVPPEAGAVIFMGGLSPEAGPGRSLDIHRDAFLAAQAVVAGDTFVTVQDTGGDFGLAANPGERAWLGGLPGLVKTAALEWPEAAVKAIDIACGDRDPRSLARALMAELLEGGPEIEVGLSADGRRMTLALEPAPPSEETPAALAEGDVVVVSGGARGVAAASIEVLAGVHRPRFVLLGRTPLAEEPEAVREATGEAALKRTLLEMAQNQGRDISPAELGREAQGVLAAREIRSTLERLTAAGSDARYISVDVRDPAAVTAALEPVRTEWGPISSVIHAAGVLADKRIEDKTAEQFERVFSTKVLGLHALLSATTADPLKAICLYSSVSGRHGNAGQSDYAMANEVLNKVAQAEARRRGAGCVVKSVNWGPWDGGMVNASLRAHFTARGVPLIPLEAGGAFLARELGQAVAGEVEVVATAEPADARSEETDPGRDWRMEIEVNPNSHPFLLDHAIKDQPVLPVVLVIEWFTRAARAVLPGFAPVALRDIHVLQGIVLDRFSDGMRFAIEARVDGIGRVELRLVANDGRVHYRGEAEMAAPGQGPSAPSETTGESHGGDWPWNPAEAYDGRLFHGSDFQVIRDLEGISSEGGVGVLDGVLAKQWTGGPWSTDPAALDGGMQLALLWALKHTGRVFLPARIGAFVSYGGFPGGDALRCRFTSRLIGHHRTETDMTFATSDGHVIAELRGLEMYPMDSQSEPSDSEDAA